MSALLAAVGATVAALFEVAGIRYLEVGQAHPHPVLVLGVIWTVASGLEDGLVWAFVGGIALDVLTFRPLGSTAFALLLAIAGTAVLAQSLSRVRPIAPILIVIAASLGYSLILLILFNALVEPIAVEDPWSYVLPGVLYDTVLAAVLGPLAVAIHDRRMDQERVDW
jgi:rod shape-determining protein MreD